jgi:hypothetical protein
MLKQPPHDESMNGQMGRHARLRRERPTPLLASARTVSRTYFGSPHVVPSLR